MNLQDMRVPDLSDAIRFTVFDAPSKDRRERHATELRRYLAARGYVIVRKSSVEALEKNQRPTVYGSISPGR